MKAWHFSRDNNRLQYNDGRLIEIGVTHSVDGEPELCEHGLHGSTRIIDALEYAPGPNLWLVDITGKIQKGKDKICGLHRTALALYPCVELLPAFARKCALRHIEKIKEYTDEYPLIVDYLESGRENIRAAARAAAWAAAREAAGAAEAAEAAAEAAAGAAEAAEAAARAAWAEAATWAADAATWAACAAARAATREAEAARAAEREWQENTIQTMIKRVER